MLASVPKPTAASRLATPRPPSESRGAPTSRMAVIARVLFLGIGYYALARVGLPLSHSEGNVSLIWPAAGVPIAALTCWGPRYVPAVFAAVFLTELTIGAALPYAAWTAAGGTLAPALGAWLLRRSPYFDSAFQKKSSIFYFLVVPAIGCMLLSGTNGALALYVSGRVAGEHFFLTWFAYWMGDAAGVLLIAPVLLAAAGGGWRSWTTRGTTPHLLGLLMALAAASWFALTNPLHYPNAYAFIFLPFPFLLGAALLGGAFIAACSTLLVSGIAVLLTANGIGPFAVEYLDDGLLSLWLFIVVASVSSFMFVSLDAARTLTLQRLRRSEEVLNATGQIASVGGWELDTEAGSIHWTDQTFRIHELLPGTEPALFDALVFFDGDGRTKLRFALERAIAYGEGYDLTLPFTTARGNHRWVRTTCSPSVHGGRTLRLNGTLQDVTKQMVTERRRQMLESIVTHAIDGVIVIEPGLAEQVGMKVLYVNKAYTRITGYTADEIEGQSLALFAGPETDRMEFERLHAALTNLTPCRQELLLYRKDGSTYWVDLHTIPVRDDSGECLHVVGIGRDITERKEAEVERLELGTRAAAVIEHAVDAIITIDEHGLIQSANPSTENLFGYDADALLGQNIKMLMPAPYHDEHDRYIANYLETGIPRIIGFTREVRGRRQDGSTFPIRLGVAEVIVGAKRLFTGTVHDLSVETELKEQLLQSRKMESLGTLAGGIAHDFNNILQSIVGFSSMARQFLEQDETDLIKQCIDEIDMGSTRAASLVEQILTFSRESNVEYAVIELREVVREVTRFLKGSLPAAIRLDAALEAGIFPVLADATQLHQLIQNLAANALHAMEKDGGVLRIALERHELAAFLDTRAGTLPPGAYARLTVADTGCGIAPDIVERVLEPFFTTKKKGKGTGLGLATVHGIISRMDGGLLIDSALEQGTTISVLVPLVHSAPPAKGETAHASLSGQESGSERILIVDDEDSIVKLFTQMLHARGFLIEGFTDTEAALASFAADPMRFDVAILDYAMPGMSGVALARALHALNPDLLLFIATGLLDGDAIDLSEDSGIVDVIRKPFRPNDLVATLRAALSRREPGP